MQAKVGSAWGFGTRWIQSILREFYINWLFIKRDIGTSTIPGLIFIVAAWYSQETHDTDLHSALAQGVLYFFLYAYTFCVPNQMVGIEEDRIDKPYRPLCRGLVTYRGAKNRWIGSMVLFSIMGWHLGVFEWTLLWQVCILLLNFGGLGQEWPTRHFTIGLGQMAQMGAAWQMLAPVTPVVWSWMLLVATVSMPLVGLQDLPDMAGDRATGQNTFPVVFGETKSRGMLCVSFLLLPILIHFGLLLPVGLSVKVILLDLGQTIISWIVALRIILYDTPEGDRRTYILFLYWYSFLLASAIFLF